MSQPSKPLCFGDAEFVPSEVLGKAIELEANGGRQRSWCSVQWHLEDTNNQGYSQCPNDDSYLNTAEINYPILG